MAPPSILEVILVALGVDFKSILSLFRFHFGTMLGSKKRRCSAFDFLIIFDPILDIFWLNVRSILGPKTNPGEKSKLLGNLAFA